MKTSDRIIEYIQQRQQVTGAELANYLTLSDRAVRKQLSTLLEHGRVSKLGKPPKVYYRLAVAPIKDLAPVANIDSEYEKVISENFFHITALGDTHRGVDGFIAWCKERGLNPEIMAQQYWKVNQKYTAYRDHGLIEGTQKLQKTFKKSQLDQLLYVDFYSVEIFGKTKLGQMLLFAKQSQDRVLINQISDIILPSVRSVIKRHKISAVGFIPPTVKRELQFMKQLENRLSLGLPIIPITKIKTPVIIPQKTLSKLEDRISNAKNTINIDGTVPYQNILLIDDAVGSGATLQEVASQMRHKKLVTGIIIGLAVTGSVKGFDVISEV